MTPRGFQEALLRVCFDSSPSSDDLRALGGERKRWLVYRGMVRRRLHRVLTECLPRTAEVAGDAWAGAIDHWLAERRPRSRYIRDIVPELAELLASDAAFAPHTLLGDTLAYEVALWCVRDAEASDVGAVGEFSFDAQPVFEPTLTWVEVSHAVWERADRTRVLPNAARVAVYRGADDRVRSLGLEGREARVAQAWSEGGESAADAARALAAEEGEALDSAFVEALCDAAATWLHEGLLLGSRPAN